MKDFRSSCARTTAACGRDGARDQPHVGPAPGFRPRAARRPLGEANYAWSDTKQRYEGARIIFTDSETSNWQWIPSRTRITGTVSSFTSPTELDNPHVRNAVLKSCASGSTRVSTACSTPCPISSSGGHHCENLPETHQFLRDLRRDLDARHDGRMLLGSQPVASDVCSFWRGRRCYIASTSADAARHGVRQEDSHPIADILRQTPDIPSSSSGRSSSNSRRADARDGHRRGARLSQRMPAIPDADQRWHRRLAPLLENEPADQLRLAPSCCRPSSTTGTRRDGRQHHLGDRTLSRRCVDIGSQRRLLARGSRPSLCADRHGPRLRVPGTQRRGAGALAGLAAELDEARDRPAPPPPRLRPGHPDAALADEPEGPRVHPPVRRRDDPVRGQPLADATARRARLERVQGRIRSS